MYIKNREEYCKIPISALNFSTRTFNGLKRANISTLEGVRNSVSMEI